MESLSSKLHQVQSGSINCDDDNLLRQSSLRMVYDCRSFNNRCAVYVNGNINIGSLSYESVKFKNQLHLANCAILLVIN